MIKILSNLIIFITIFFISFQSHSNTLTKPKFSITCDSVEFNIESDLSSPLKSGEIRYVDKFLASFLNTDSFSSITSSECVGDKNRLCLSKGNNVFCQNPVDKFKIKSIKDDNSVIMVKNRCESGFRKYQISNKTNKSLIYIEDRMYFKINNQIHQTYDNSSYTKPTIILKQENDNNVTFSLESFDVAHFPNNSVNSETLGLSLSRSDLHTGLHDKYSLITNCSQ